MVAAIRDSLVHGRAASWMATISDFSDSASSPFQTESWRSLPPATSRKLFLNPKVWASSWTAACIPSRTTRMISSMQAASSKRRQVRASTGTPLSSRNSLSTLGPMRVPLPAATIMAEVISGRNSPIEDLELDGLLAVEMFELRNEGQIERTHRQRFLSRPPPQSFARCFPVRDPHFHMLLAGADALQRTLMNKFARHELWLRVALAYGFEVIERAKAFEIHLVEADLRVQAQRLLQVIGAQSAAGDGVEPFAKRFEI